MKFCYHDEIFVMMTAIIDDDNVNLIHPPVFEAMPSSIRQGITVIMIIHHCETYDVHDI